MMTVWVLRTMMTWTVYSVLKTSANQRREIQLTGIVTLGYIESG